MYRCVLCLRYISLHGGFSPALDLVLAGHVTCSRESMALEMKTWILPLATGKISLCCLVSLCIGLGPDLLLDSYNVSEELRNRLCSQLHDLGHLTGRVFNKSDVGSY